MFILSSALAVSATDYSVGLEELKTATEYKGSYYKVYDSVELTWSEADEYCKSIGGHLVTITSEGEQIFIEKLLENHNKNFYWIGGYEEQSHWVWTTGEPFAYNNWEKDQPDDGKGDENYLMVYNKVNIGNSLYTWNDIKNDGTFPNEDFWGVQNSGIICEWDYCCISENGNYKNHSWNEWQNISDATCLSNGEQKKVCSICDTHEIKTIPALAHVYNEWGIVEEAKCGQTGLEERICNLCGNIDAREVVALSHDYSNYEIVSGSKLIPPIVKERKCILCGDIDRINDWSYVWITALAGIAVIGVIIGLISYIRAFKRR